jgi:hypothetical protein
VKARHPNRPNSYRRKRRSCGVCHPSKRGEIPHFSDREKLIRQVAA